MVLIHSYLTNGKIMFDFAQEFLKSLKIFTGEKYPVFFIGKDLSESQIITLKKIYKNLEIKNEKIDFDYLTKIMDVPIEEIKRMKYACETKYKNVGVTKCVLWKQFISVEDRYKTSLKDGLLYCKEKGYSNMLHLDIDTCFYNSIDPIIDILKKHDVSLQFRSDFKKMIDKMNICGGTVGLTANDNAFKFLDFWIKEINKVKLKDRINGFGQLSLYYAVEKIKDDIDIGHIPMEWSTTWPRVKKKNFKNDIILLTGNKGKKEGNLKDFKKIIKMKVDPKYRKEVERLEKLKENKKKAMALKIKKGK